MPAPLVLAAITLSCAGGWVLAPEFEPPPTLEWADEFTEVPYSDTPAAPPQPTLSRDEYLEAPVECEPGYLSLAATSYWQFETEPIEDRAKPADVTVRGAAVGDDFVLDEHTGSDTLLQPPDAADQHVVTAFCNPDDETAAVIGNVTIENSVYPFSISLERGAWTRRTWTQSMMVAGVEMVDDEFYLVYQGGDGYYCSPWSGEPDSVLRPQPLDLPPGFEVSTFSDASQVYVLARKLRPSSDDKGMRTDVARYRHRLLTLRDCEVQRSSDLRFAEGEATPTSWTRRYFGIGFTWNALNDWIILLSGDGAMATLRISDIAAVGDHSSEPIQVTVVPLPGRSDSEVPTACEPLRSPGSIACGGFDGDAVNWEDSTHYENRVWYVNVAARRGCYKLPTAQDPLCPGP